MNGRIGDDPINDILDGHPVYSDAIDSLIAQAAKLSDVSAIEELRRSLPSPGNIDAADLDALEADLLGRVERLRAEGAERGWEVEGT